MKATFTLHVVYNVNAQWTDKYILTFMQLLHHIPASISYLSELATFLFDLLNVVCLTYRLYAARFRISCLTLGQTLKHVASYRSRVSIVVRIVVFEMYTVMPLIICNVLLLVLCWLCVHIATHHLH